jgi:2,4-dienoyl-CoA reductase [(3E)-enoyl-CoA-producing], peroxisomal
MMAVNRLYRLSKTAKELSEATGRTCIPAQADVRDPKSLRDAVSKTIEKFGRIDFVICGVSLIAIDLIVPNSSFVTGAAGNFLAPISGISENAFRTVVEIDTVSSQECFLCPHRHLPQQKLGTFNTIKATIAHVRASKGSYILVSATLHYNGNSTLAVDCTVIDLTAQVLHTRSMSLRQRQASTPCLLSSPWKKDHTGFGLM